jgi:hypothetical protein
MPGNLLRQKTLEKAYSRFMPAQDAFDHLVMGILALGHKQNLRQSVPGDKCWDVHTVQPHK